jgi:hypothetical protein
MVHRRRHRALRGGRAGISDRSDAPYPILARMLAARRDNVRDTITTALESRLSTLDQAEPVTEPAYRKAAEMTQRLRPSDAHLPVVDFGPEDRPLPVREIAEAWAGAYPYRH